MQRPISPLPDELPTMFADRLSKQYNDTVKQGHKKEFGQFFTPTEVACFMAGLVDSSKDNISVLDPGCGVGVLACALIESLAINYGLTKINLVVFELDEHILIYTKRALDYLKVWLKVRGIELSHKIKNSDFVINNSSALNLQRNLYEESSKFDYIISNPPYFKLAKEDSRVKAISSIVKGQTNIYVAFMAIACKLLNENGEMIFITPRSFASGKNFKLFRKLFFLSVKLKHVHLFDSRKRLFSRDYISQENIIVHAKNEKGNLNDYSFFISSSKSIHEINHKSYDLIKINEVVDLDSKEIIMTFPSNEWEYNVISIFRKWKNRLSDFDISVSTGPVVFFRAANFMKLEYENANYLPMIWPHNVEMMKFIWPTQRPGRSNYIELTEKSKSILVNNNNYVFVRRFSSKDENIRLVAAPYISNFNHAKRIGIENRLNYIYKKSCLFNDDEVIGLAALLSSKLYNTYFRISNGSVNISATELRDMPIPHLSVISEIGRRISIANAYDKHTINEIVINVLNLNNEYILK